MQTLDTINLGQTPNDGAGDEHRTAFQKVNANFGKVVEGIGEVGDAAQAASQLASEAIPAVEIGVAGGVAPLDDAGKVPAEHLPELEEFIPMAQKGAPEGVATLGVDGKVTPGQLPNAVDAIPLAQKGLPGGVATLDTEGLVPEDQLPDFSFVPQAEKGEPGGVATLDVDGLVPENQLPPIPSGPAVGTPNWWPLRTSIPAGQLPLDGQEVNRATYPDLTAMVVAGTLPVVAEATWQGDPTQRGKYTLGDGSTTIRVPDMNGKAAGSLGAVFRRGDGEMSAGTNGLIQRDALQNLTGAMTTRSGAGGVGALVSSSGAFQSATKATGSGIGFIAYAAGDGAGDQTTFDASRVARTAAETRPLNVTGVWTVHAFGAVVNPGSVDAAQLASDLAALDAEFQTLVGQIEFTIIYPNGGSEASPANIAINSQYVLTNPFPGHHVILEPEVLYEGNWGNPGWWSGDANMAGIRATMRNNSIILSTAKNALGIGYPLGGGAFTYTGSTGIGVAGLPARIKVWKVKGAVA